MRQKTIDCVKMKHDIQQRILQETAGLSTEEQRRLTEQRILADPLLARIWREARRRDTAQRPVS